VEFIRFISLPQQKKVKNVNPPRLTPIEGTPRNIKVLNRRVLSSYSVLKQRTAIRFNFSVRPSVKKKRKAWLTRRWWWLCPRRWLAARALTFRPNFKIRTFSRGGSLTKVKGFEPRWFFKRYTHFIRHPNLQGHRRLGFFRRPPIIRDKSAIDKKEMDLDDFILKNQGETHPRLTKALRRPRGWAFTVTGNAYRNGQIQLDPYKTNVKPLPPNRVSRVCLVQGNRNFWGILHHRHKMVTHVSAGQMPDSGGSRRTDPPAIFGVARAIARSLRSVFQGISDKHFSRTDRRRRRPRRPRRRRQRQFIVPAHIARRYRKRWVPKWLKRTFEQVRRPRFHLFIKLKNFQPYKQVWWGRMVRFILKNAAFKKRGLKLFVTVETVVFRPHNGLRPRKPTRQ